MTVCEFQVHPKALVDLLGNAVDIGKDPASISVNNLVMLAVSGARLYAYGRGRYSAGYDWRPIDFEADVPYDVCITLTEAEAGELASTLRGVEGYTRKGSVVAVALHERSRLVITSGTEVLCELPDADPDDKTFGNPNEVSDWEEIEALIHEAAATPRLTSPFAMGLDILTRLNKIRADTPIADLAISPDRKRIAVALGTSFRGVVVGSDRAIYAAGAERGDGPGRPEHLWGEIPPNQLLEDIL